MAIEDILGWDVERIFAENVTPDADGKHAYICGFVQKVRKAGKDLAFVIIKDRTGDVQITISRENAPQLIDMVSELTPESAVALSGQIKATDKTKRGVEILPAELYVLNKANTPLPLANTSDIKTSPDTRFDYRYLDLRSPQKALIMRTLTETLSAMRNYCLQNKFLEIQSPKIMGAASETGAELFELSNYFGKKAFLAQSPQFYKQMAIASGLDRVFEIAPVFRANPSHTSRHDTEFSMFDAEIGWINSHEDVMKFEESWLSYVIQQVKDKYGKQIKENFGVEITVPKIPFPRITMDEAHDIVKCAGGRVIPGQDLDAEGEKLVGEYVSKKYGHEFVFITDFPWAVRPFYHMRPENNPNITNSFDLLWKGLEITTGAQREHRYEKLIAQAKEKGLNPDPIKWYLDMFKYGAPPHGGFGLSPTRVVMQMLNLPHVREATFAYRSPDRLSP